ncbi:MAG: flagellar protein FlaG [Desulfobulbus sp.]|nr:flagellar protein FlaG [Desulfobulbus sp.]
MNIEAVGTSIASPPRANEPSQQVESKRQASQQNNPSSAEEQSKAQPEELLQQIKSLTEDGVYSVRFEQESESQQLIVKIVDQETDEVIRQIPPEELLNLTKNLKELAGSIVNIHG